MAKIANVQLPVRQNGQLPVQTAKDVKGADDFVNLLQQKTETAKQPDKTDATSSKEQPETKPALKEPSEQTEQTELKEEGPDNLLDQAALEQLAVQMSVVSSSWQEPVQTEMRAVSAELVQTEVSAVPAEPVADVMEAIAEPVLTPAVPESEGGLQEAAVENQPELVPQVKTQKPYDKSQEAPRESVRPSKSTEAVETPEMSNEAPEPLKKAEPVHTADAQTLDAQAPKEQPKSSLMEEQGSQTTSMEGQEVTAAGAAVQQPVSQTEGVFETEKSTTTELKTTMEELPQELGKVLSSGKLNANRTLTVELEPASLGKLTIKVSYEAGRTAVSILASNPKSFEILNQKATEIAAILKERTGEETVIYTQEPQQQHEEDSYDGHQGSQSQEREERSRQDEGKERETESFAQQLRLGLV